MDTREFVKHFGKSWIVDFDLRFIRILVVTSSCLFALIVYLATFDYVEIKPDVHAKIEQRYKDFIISFLDEYAAEKPDPALETRGAYYSEPGPAGKKKEIEEFLKESGLIDRDESKTGRFSDLPDLNFSDIAVGNFEELTAPVPPTRFMKNPNRQFRNYKTVPLEDLMDDPYAYKIKRSANIYIETPEQYSQREPEPRGYRDQDEIMQVLDDHRHLIEICYRKLARNGLVDKGHVQVEFKISYKGFVLPESIRILNSTIRNKSVEQCIKKNIRRLRTFEELEEEKGIAHVVHKFVFY